MKSSKSNIIEDDLALSFLDEYNICETPKKEKFQGKLLALLAGVCSMIPQNGLIVTFDYFQTKFIDYNVYFYMVIPIAVGMTIMSILIYPLSSKLKIYDRIYIGNSACICLVPLLPIMANAFPNSLGFWICMTIILLLGLSVQLITSGGISFSSAFPKENYTTFLFSGFAFSGILCSILRIILLSIFGTTQEALTQATMIFFGIFTVIFLITIKIVHSFSLLNYSITHLSKIEGKIITNLDKVNQLEMIEIGNIDQDNNSTNVSRLTDFNQLSDSGEDEQKYPINIVKQQQKKSSSLGFQSLKQVIDQIWPMPLLIIIFQIQTNIMFPGYAISKLDLQGISMSWKTTTIAFTWTIADVSGRIFTPYLPQSEYIVSKVVKFRYLNCLIFVFLVQPWCPILLRYFIYLNIFIFAFAHGWSSTLSTIIGGGKATTEQKETSSAIIGLAINIGIIIGMTSALLLI